MMSIFGDQLKRLFEGIFFIKNLNFYRLERIQRVSWSYSYNVFLYAGLNRNDTRYVFIYMSY
jgi:hypothetical protein